MKKKILCLILSLMMGFSVMQTLVGCSGDREDLYILLLANSAEDKFYQKHFEQLEKDLDIKIKYNCYAASDYYEALKSDLDLKPDIIYIRPSDIKKLSGRNFITPIDTEVNAQKEVDLSGIYESAITSYKYDKATKKMGSGDLYAVPKDLSVQQLGYNKTILERNQQKIKNSGIKKMPWEMDFSKENYTLEEFKTMAALCQDSSSATNPIYGMDVPNIEILTWAFGGSLISEDGQSIQTDSEAFKKAVAYQADLIESGAANFSGAKHDVFLQGRVAFYGEVNSFDIKVYDATFKELKQEWDVMPWPVEDNSTKEKATAWKGKISSAGYAVTSTCKNKELAVKVALTFTNRKTQNTLVANEKLTLPLYKDIAEEAFISSDNDDIYAPKGRKVYIDVISGRNGKFSDEYRTYDLLWKDAMKNYLDELWKSEPKDIKSKLKSDAAYTELKNTMQAAYDESKNK